MLQRPRIIRLVVAGMLLGTTIFIAAPTAPAKQRCTVKGTAGDDHLIDTAGASRICAFGGNDIVEAGQGNDVVLGGKGSDRLEGNEGKDVVRGGRGADTIVLADGAGNDRAYGGPGRTPATSIAGIEPGAARRRPSSGDRKARWTDHRSRRLNPQPSPRVRR
jgi:Ca2+-binding RTX toxin-like protein